jgi:hypothetical protein
VTQWHGGTTVDSLSKDQGSNPAPATFGGSHWHQDREKEKIQVAIAVSTVVGHSAHNPKNEGFNPVSVIEKGLLVPGERNWQKENI